MFRYTTLARKKCNICFAIIQEINKQPDALSNVIDIIHELFCNFMVTNNMLVIKNNFVSLNNRTSQTSLN